MTTVLTLKRTFALFLVALSSWLPLNPLAQLALDQARAEEPTATLAVSDSVAAAVDQHRGEGPEETVADGRPDSVKNLPEEQLARTMQIAGIATTDVRRLDLNGVDRQQLEALQKLAEQIALDPAIGTRYSAGNLPPGLQKTIDIDKLSNYDPRLIRSILYLVTPSELGGAGQELLGDVTLTKGYRTKTAETETESLTPDGESDKLSPHFYERGEAADVGAIDYLRGTQFTLENGSDGRVVIKETKHLPLEPITIAWQDPGRVAQTSTGSLAALNRADPLATGTTGLLRGLLGGMAQNLDRTGADIDLSQFLGKITSIDNLGQLAWQMGSSYLPQALQTSGQLFIGPTGLRQTGQQALAQAVDDQIPAFGFFGDNPDELFYNSGREITTRNLGLPEGGLIGRTSADVITNAGERFWEGKLGDLPLGTLDGIKTGDRADLERHVGRGQVAKLFGLEVGSLPLSGSPTDFERSLGLNWDDLQANGQLVSNQLSIPTTDSVSLIKHNPDSWLQQIGQATLAQIEIYTPATRDDLFNLSARPTILELPTGTDQEKAHAILDRYAFKFDASERLSRIQAGTETFAANVAANDDELRAWLLWNAYATGTDPNQELLTNRFLAASDGAFYDTGIEVITKGMTANNTGRAAVRSYMRTGDLPAESPVDLNQLAQRAGFSSRADFDAVFRDSAPVVGFAHTGRLQFARVFAKTPETAATGLAKPVLPSTDQLTERLSTLRDSLKKLRGDSSIRPQLDAALGATDELMTATQDKKGPPSLNLTSQWRDRLAKINTAVQAAANSNRTGLVRAREALVAINGLLTPSGESANQIDANTLTLPGGQAATQTVASVFRSGKSMTQATERIGGWQTDRALNLDPGQTYELTQAVGRELRQGNMSGAQRVLERFASTHTGPLGEAAGSVQSTVRQLGGSQPLEPVTLARSLVSGWKLLTDLGSHVLTTGMGASQTKPVGQILQTLPLGPEAYQALQTSVGLRSLAQGLTSTRDLLLSPEEAGGEYEALLYSTVSAQTGWTITPSGPESGDNPQAYIESMTGAPLTHERARALGITDTSSAGLTQAAKTTKFWEDPALIPRLERMLKSSFPGLGNRLPDGILPALFDRSMDSQERTTKLDPLFQSVVTSRLVDPLLANTLTINGLPGGAVVAAKNVLTSKAPPAEKSAAIRSLGLVTADAVMTARFGFPVSWLVDKTIDPKQKGRIGLGLATRSLGLDPALSNLADQAYQTFFIDQGIDTSTPAGRAQLAGLMLAAGSAAKVPPEYAAVAAGFVTGDVESTALAYAGGHFNQTLREAGIFSVGIADFYEAIAGPTRSTLDSMKAEVDAELSSRFPGDAKDTYESEYAAFSNDLLAEKISNFQQAKQEQLMFAGIDLGISKATGVYGISGMAQAFMKGTLTDQAAATGQLVSAISGSPEAAAILGNRQLVSDLQKFATSKNPDDISKSSYASLDGWLGYATDVPIPPGTSEAVIGYTSTGDSRRLEAVVNPTTLVGFGGGYIDSALGLPSGATGALYGAYHNVQTARVAYETAKIDALNQSIGFDGLLGDTPDLLAAKINLGIANAGLVSTGVNLIFGETFAKLDGSLGLPTGTLSMLVSTGIYAAMVPGIAIGSLLMTTVLPWAAPLLLAQLFGLDLGSLFGGDTQSKIRPVTIWSSYPNQWPEEVDYACRKKTDDPPITDEKRPKGNVVDRGDYTCEVGEQIVFASELPPGLFYGPPPEDLAPAFAAGREQAANLKAEQLVGNLLGMSTDRGLSDETMTPLQIRSHTKTQGENNQAVMDEVWGDGTLGSYIRSIGDGVLESRKGYLYDTPGQSVFFADHVHWNY